MITAILMFVDDDSIISYNENKIERNSEVESKFIDNNDKGTENIDYISVKGRHNSITNIKNDRSCKNDDNKNFGGGDYRGERRRVCSETPARITND